MKRILLALLLVSGLFSAQAQNIQLHYDLGKDRKFFTSTVEMFRPDNWGTSFSLLIWTTVPMCEM